jgi:predicted nucleic acid-binding protein
MAWCFKDEMNDYANAVRDGLDQNQAVGPSLWSLDVANAVVVGERRKRSTPAQAAAWLSFLGALPIVTDGETSARAWGDTLNLARAHSLSAYDAAYLELAMRRGIAIATLDDQLKSRGGQGGGAPARCQPTRRCPAPRRPLNWRRQTDVYANTD